jgi:hypothetical protein
MTRQSLQAIRHVLTVKQPQNIARDGQALLVKVAREGIAKIRQEQFSRAGVAPDVEVRVNGQTGRSIETVHVPGPIDALFDYRREIAEVGLVALQQASPRQSGAYANAHTVLLNGRSVLDLPANLARGDVIVLVNPLAYARRLEIGKTRSGRKFVLQVKDRIYERVAKNILMQRYREVADISFGYIDLEGAYITKAALPSHYLIAEKRRRGSNLGGAGTQKRRRRNQKAGTAVRSPAITIRMKR